MDDDAGATWPQWWLFRGTGQVLDPAERDRRWPAPPRWRAFDGGPDQPPPPAPVEDAEARRRLGAAMPGHPGDPPLVARVNAAVFLRRPLLVTGPPGSGKSTLAYRVAHELGLGRVLRWQVTTRTTLQSGLYDYDAIGRAQAGGETPVGDFVHLGPVGTALLPYRLPRVLLVDELDNGDIDLPHDLREVFAAGEFTLRELARVAGRTPQVTVHTADPDGTAAVRHGLVRCHEFPVVVVTGTDERDLPASFTRRCVRVTLPEPDEAALAAIVSAHFPDCGEVTGPALRAFLRRRDRVGGLPVEQLLDEVALRAGSPAGDEQDADALVEAVWPSVPPAGAG